MVVVLYHGDQTSLLVELENNSQLAHLVLDRWHNQGGQWFS
jgi:hypothetical protein